MEVGGFLKKSPLGKREHIISSNGDTGYTIKLSELLEDYANKRVIEELQQVADGYMGDDVMSMEYIINRIKELKQK